MAFADRPGVLERILRFRALKWEHGALSLWNIPGFFHAAYVNVYEQRLMEKLHGKRTASDFFYNVGKFQGIQGFRTLARKFGFDKIVRNRRRLLAMQTQQSNVVGFGSFEWVRMDFQHKFFVLRGRSVFAEEYRSFFGLQREPVCHLIRGLAAGFLQEVAREPIFSVERGCSASGSPWCEFVLKPHKAWSTTELNRSQQIPNRLHSMSSLGAVREPYLRVP